MADAPKWWMPTDPADLNTLAENRAAFVAQFGSFEEVSFEAFWLGSSEDGRFLGLQLHRPDGSVHRFALPVLMTEIFLNEMVLAIDGLAGNAQARLMVEEKVAGMRQA